MIEEQDHYKECSKSGQTRVRVTTEKEPEVLLFDFKWANVKPLELLQFYAMFPNSLNLSDIFHLKRQTDHKYMIKGVIMFCQAHYYAYYRVKVSKEYIWLRCDDTTVTKRATWGEIVRESCDTLAHPTMVFYEKVPREWEYESQAERSFRLDDMRDLVRK